MRWFGARLGRTEQTLVAVAGASLALILLQTRLPSLEPWRQFSVALLLVLGGLAAMIRLGQLGKWLVRKFLWRVRHRMVAVFFFVGVVPLSIGAVLVCWGVLALLGPLTAHMVRVQLDRQLDRLQATAQPLLWRLREAAPDDRVTLLQTFHARAAGTHPGLIIGVDLEDFQHTHPQGSLPQVAVPQGDLANQTLVLHEGSRFLVAETEADGAGGRVIMAIPLTSEVMSRAMPGLGVLALPRERAGGQQRPEGDQVGTVMGIRPARHPFDWVAQWPIEVSILNWDTSESEKATYVLRTRLSAMWETVFGDQPTWGAGLLEILGYLLLAAFLASVLVSLVIAASLTRTLTRSVHDLYVGTRHVNTGDLSYRVPVSGSDQVSDLSHSFNAMTQSIEELIEESKRRQQLEAELEIAREVQSRLFPARSPDIDGLDILGVCRPAQSVSGDFFDYVRLDRNHLAISFGDVSGKGISAALVMASLHSIVRAQLAMLQDTESGSGAQSAARLVTQANRQLCENTAPEKFSTLFFGAYDTSSGTLCYSNAGHLPPVLLRNGTLTPLQVNGMIVGAFPFAEYTATHVSLEAGDTLVAYTDGLTEPENQNGEEFGEGRLQAALRRQANLPTRQLIENVMDEVVRWTGQATQQDDMTMLVLRKQA